MKAIVANLVTEALGQLSEIADVAADISMATTVERTRDPSHGDLASNVAMRLAKPARKNPRELAASIVASLPASELVDKVEIAGPGFINFYLSDRAFHAELRSILEQGSDYVRRPRQARPRILLEFISANPTGPLHVGHGRMRRSAQRSATFLKRWAMTFTASTT